MNVHSRHTLCAISLNDLRGFVLTEPGEHKVLLCLKPTGHFWVFLLKIQSGGGLVGGSLTTVILKCLLTLEMKTSNHSLSADVFLLCQKS